MSTSVAVQSSEGAAWRTARYPIRLLSPAFLGNADQEAEWRTPPLKALLRQWWRVAKGAQTKQPDLVSIRQAEGELFGTVLGKAAQSRVRLRIESGAGPRKGGLPALARVSHPQLKVQTDPLLYLGYGPYQIGWVRPYLPSADASAALRVAYRLGDEGLLLQAVQLASWFGTIGSRSRNGWGSLEFGGMKSFADCTAAVLKPYCRPLEICLQTDWPDAIGSDGRPLVWTSKSASGAWPEALRELADRKIKLRTLFPLTGEKRFQQLHFFGLPITHHELGDKQQRWASQLRFKLVSSGSELRTIAVHLPAHLPERLLKPGLDELGFWTEVHKKLDDENSGWARLP